MPWILLHQTWQMNLLWLMNLLSTRAEMTCIPLHQTWQMNLLWLNKWQRFESSSIHHFWDTPQHFLKMHFCLESGFLSLLELQKSLLVSRVIENWCIEYCYTKLGRWTYYGWWTPPVPEQRWLAYHYTKPGRWTYFGQWTSPQYESRDDLHTTTQNLADEPNLANEPHQYQSRDDLHTTTQNLADEPTLAEHNGKGLKALAFTISEIPHNIFSKHIFA